MFYKCYESVEGLIDEFRPPEPGLILALDEAAEVILDMLSRENRCAPTSKQKLVCIMVSAFPDFLVLGLQEILNTAQLELHLELCSL